MSHRDYCCGLECEDYENEDEEDIDFGKKRGYRLPIHGSAPEYDGTKRHNSTPRQYVGMSSMGYTPVKTVYDGIDESKADECRSLIQTFKREGKWLGADRDDHFSLNVYSINSLGQVLENVFDNQSGTYAKHRVVGDRRGPSYNGWIFNDHKGPHSFS